MKRKSLFFIIFTFMLLLCSSLSAQNKKIDSLRLYLKTAKEDTSKVNGLNMFAKEFEFIDQDTSCNYLTQSYKLAQKLHFESGRMVTLTYLGYLAEDRSEFDSALTCYHLAHKISLATGDKMRQANLLKMIGEAVRYKGDLTGALGFFQESLNMYEEQNSDAGMAQSYYSLGGLYQDLKRFDKAMDCFKKTLEIDKRLKIPIDIANALTAVGVTYNNQHDYKSAKQYYLEAKKIYEDEQYDNGLSNCLTWIAITAYNEKDIPTALDYFQRSLVLYEKMNSMSGLMYSYNNIGSIYADQGKYDKALQWEKKSLEMAIQSKGIEYMRYSYETLANTYAKMGDYKNAYESHQLYMRYKDSLLNESTSKQLSEMDKRFETEKKNKELIRKDAELLKQNAKIDQQANQRNYLLLGVGLMAVVALFIFRGYRQKQKANEIIASQKDEVEKQKELLEEKQKEIVDSITYAKRLQQAILPPLSHVRNYFPESFILFKPKDIVAGDFYWMEVIDDGLVLIAAADCTGHGVPGAMVSVVCSNALNRTVKEFGITEPGKILDKVRELVIETFQKSESEVKDGMDISLCAINLKNKKMQWAGANNPLWIVRDNETLELKADKQPIGKTEKPTTFTTHAIEIRKSDVLYLFTDGFADQFGGEKGKKFKYKPFQDMLLAQHSKPMDSQLQTADATLENWKGKLDQVDDILVVGIRI